MIDVVCVFWGTKFSVDYVHNLKAMVERNTTIPHNFICLSDRPIDGIETRFLKPGYSGWWNKIQMFDPNLYISRRVVYLDLDTLVVNNIDWLLEYNGKFMGIEDVGSVNAHQPHLKNVLQTGVMSFDRSATFNIWTEFVFTHENVIKYFRGDGEYLQNLIKGRDLLQHLYPGKLKSYKYQVYPNRPDAETAIICFHGRPSVVQAMNETITTPMRTYEPVDWIKEYWRK